jgi:hypothetical protein
MDLHQRAYPIDAPSIQLSHAGGRWLDSLGHSKQDVIGQPGVPGASGSLSGCVVRPQSCGEGAVSGRLRAALNRGSDLRPGGGLSGTAGASAPICTKKPMAADGGVQA